MSHSSRCKPLLPYLFNLIFVLAFFIHATFIAFRIKFPSNPSVKVYKKELKDINFPISLKLCVEERVDFNKRYQDLGYDAVHMFFGGIGMHENGKLGWSGYSSYDNGSILGSVGGKFSFSSYQKLYLGSRNSYKSVLSMEKYHKRHDYADWKGVEGCEDC